MKSICSVLLILLAVTASALAYLPEDLDFEVLEERPGSGSETQPAPTPEAREAERDGRYIGYSNGVVLDTKTKLEWLAGPDKSTTWHEAEMWAESLTVAGGGWRMPTRKELGSLYQKGVGTRNMTPLLKTTGWYVWSGEARDSSSAWNFDFYGGGEGWGPRSGSGNGRGFAVRSRLRKWGRTTITIHK